ncbi:thioesterase-like superfamily-domain-containing protein [Halenospora varia]|nr:thioesterase-like superfamily-domain-containing protein [Halenospora varia]
MSSIPFGKTFKESTQLKALSSHTYEAQFSDEWCIGSVPHGGYVTSVFLCVASQHFGTTLSKQNQPHTIALHLDFLRRTEAGPALFTVKDIKIGRQTSVIHITLSQSGREEVVGYITNSNMHTEDGVSFNTSYSLNPPPPEVSLDLLSQDKDKNWARQAEMPFASFRKATYKSQFHFPRKGQQSKSSADEWIRLSTGEKWTNASLGYVCDMWPMPIEAYIREENPYGGNTLKDEDGKEQSGVRKFWYPTVLLNIDFKKPLPEEGVEWLFARVEAKQIKNGRMDLEVVVMDGEGDIVALSHHVALAVSSERNLAKRTTGSSKI